MIGLYRDGSSLLHRLPAGAKLLGLLLVGVASPFVRSPLVTASGLLLVLAGYTVARMPLRVLLHLLRPLLLVMVPLAVFQTIVAGWQRASVIVGVLLALAFLRLVPTAAPASPVAPSPRADRRFPSKPEPTAQVLTETCGPVDQEPGPCPGPAPPHSAVASSRLRILPVAVLGSPSRTLTVRGYL